MTNTTCKSRSRRVAPGAAAHGSGQRLSDSLRAFVPYPHQGSRKKLPICLAVAALIAPMASSPALAGNTDHDISQFISNPGTIAFLISGVGLPLVEDGANGKNHTLRTIDSLGPSVFISEALSQVISEDRPDHSDKHSFPSTHATAAFSIAAMQSQFHPRQAPFWYGGAVLISASRLDLRKHHIQDVIAGGLIGFGMSKWELSRKHGLILRPYINPDTHPGFGIAARF